MMLNAFENKSKLQSQFHFKTTAIFIYSVATSFTRVAAYVWNKVGRLTEVMFFFHCLKELRKRIKMIKAGSCLLWAPCPVYQQVQHILCLWNFVSHSFEFYSSYWEAAKGLFLRRLRRWFTSLRQGAMSPMRDDR